MDMEYSLVHKVYFLDFTVELGLPNLRALVSVLV